MRSHCSSIAWLAYENDWAQDRNSYEYVYRRDGMGLVVEFERGRLVNATFYPASDNGVVFGLSIEKHADVRALLELPCGESIRIGGSR
jgi:hypothetical protein